MKYSGIIKNDFTAQGVCTTIFISGCDLHCPGCHNPAQQDYNFGEIYTLDTTKELIAALTENNVHRDLCIMGGEPLSPRNREGVAMMIMDILHELPDTKILVWTGYTYEELLQDLYDWPNELFRWLLNKIDILVDGPYIQEQRDVSLKMRGSRNQKILKREGGEFIDVSFN